MGNRLRKISAGLAAQGRLRRADDAGQTMQGTQTQD